MLVLIRRFVELEWVERDGSVSGLSGRMVGTKLPLILKAAAVHCLLRFMPSPPYKSVTILSACVGPCGAGASSGRVPYGLSRHYPAAHLVRLKSYSMMEPLILFYFHIGSRHACTSQIGCKSTHHGAED